MTTWIFAVLGLFLLQTLLPSSLRYFGSENMLMNAVGPRDEPPPMPVSGARAQRALNNMMEAMPFFLTFALLLLFQNKVTALATTGAMVFFIARTIYVPAYISGIPFIRSTCWMGGWVGMGMMLSALFA